MPELNLEDYIVNLRSPEADVRRNAAWILGRSRDLRIIEPLIAALHDPDTAVRVRVAESLGNLRDARAIAPLIQAAAQEADDEVRAQLVASLGRQGDPQGVETLLNALYDAAGLVRAAAAGAFVTMPDSRAVAGLTTLLLNDTDPNPNIRYYAARALGIIGGTVVVEALSAGLIQTSNPERKIQMIEILGQLQDRHAAEILRNLLNDPDPGVVETAEWALRQVNAG